MMKISATAATNADLYDPASDTFGPAGTEAFARLYHSISLLMPDRNRVGCGRQPDAGDL